MVMTFEDVLDIKNGKNQKAVENPDGKYPIYGSGGIMGYADQYICDANTVIIGRKGSINNPIYVETPFWNVDTAFGLVAKPEKLIPKYLYYFCKYFDFDKLNTTVTIPSLTKANLLKIKIKVPEVDQQKKEVKVLDKVNHLIESRRTQLKDLDNLIKSRFIEMFGDPLNNPKRWIKAQMGEYLTTLTDFSANGSYETLDSNVTMYDDPNYALMVRTTDLEKQDFENGVKYIDENAYELLEKSKVFGNEIIMNKIGSAGKIYLMPCLNRPVSLGRNAFLFRYSKNINPVFIYNLLSTDYGTYEIMRHVRGAVTKTITKDATRSVKIIVPPIDLQNQFATFVQQVDKLKIGVKKSLDETQILFGSLMQKYFE
jgi:type I restriction enzyme, S subunit